MRALSREVCESLSGERVSFLNAFDDVGETLCSDASAFFLGQCICIADLICLHFLVAVAHFKHDESHEKEG